MSYVGSYLWNLRQEVGSRLLLVPGAQMLLVDEADRVLLQQNVDYGLWGLPAGACEEGASFASTAVQELAEETGLQVLESELTAFACLSDPDIHILRYPNGDLTHCFAVCFEARAWSGELQPEPGEVIELGFFPFNDLPTNLHEPTVIVLELYQQFRATGRFQARLPWLSNRPTTARPDHISRAHMPLRRHDNLSTGRYISSHIARSSVRSSMNRPYMSVPAGDSAALTTFDRFTRSNTGCAELLSSSRTWPCRAVAYEMSCVEGYGDLTRILGRRHHEAKSNLADALWFTPISGRGRW